jgi:hypothetical protein
LEKGSEMNTAVEEVVALLRTWQPLPKYSVERRIDAWLAPFLAPYLQSTRGGEVRLVASEFPIRKKKQGAHARTVNADFLLHRNPDPSRRGDRESWMLLELKTDGGSVRPAQFREYFRTEGEPPERWRMGELLEGIRYVREHTSAEFRAGYGRILRTVAAAGNVNAEVEVLCVGPTRVEHPGVESIGLRKLTHWEPDGEDRRALWAALIPLLRGIAASGKARRSPDVAKEAA